MRSCERPRHVVWGHVQMPTERERHSRGNSLTVHAWPHQWHQKEFMFSAEISLWLWQTYFFLSWFLVFSETLGIWPVGGVEWLSQAGKSLLIRSSLPLTLEALKLSPELGPSPLPTLCPCLCNPLALSQPELTHPYSLFTYHLCHSFSLCNYIFEFKSPILRFIFYL